MLKSRDSAQGGVALHLKGLRSHSRNVGDAPRALMKMPAIATQTLTNVKISCRDHPSCCSFESVCTYSYPNRSLWTGRIGEASMEATLSRRIARTNDMMFETYNSCVFKRVPLVEELVFRRILLVDEIRMAGKNRDDSQIKKKATRQLGLR